MQIVAVLLYQYLIFFFLSDCYGQEFTTLLKKSESDYPCLFPDLAGRLFFIIQEDDSCGLSYVALNMLKCIPSIPNPPH